MTEDELEAEREAQRENGQVPKYAGTHSNLTAEQIAEFEQEGRKPSIRIRVPKNHSYTFHDSARGNITFESSDFGDWVIVKKNGIPTYNFAVVIDDYIMQITDVLCGDEHMPSTTRQVMVYGS